MLAAQTADFGLAGATLTGQALGSSAIGAAMVAALPVAVAVAAAVAIFSKWQSDQEPRYGTLAAMTGGSAAGLEDSEWGAASGAYVKGSFGLNFGLTDKGSKNMEATELTRGLPGPGGCLRRPGRVLRRRPLQLHRSRVAEKCPTSATA